MLGFVWSPSRKTRCLAQRRVAAGRSRWFTSGPLGMLGTVQVANPGASPGFGVIVKGQMNQAGLGAWAIGWGGAAPHPIDKYFQFGWARAIKPLPGENWLES
jgi:hypothetical protein